MITLSLAQVAVDIGGRVVRGAGHAQVRGVSTDTRTLAAGQLFVALSGPNFDGRTFIAMAEERGAAAALVSANTPHPDGALPLVEAPGDTLAALGVLANAHRERCDARVIGLTGSAGKTTTKEMIAAILAEVGPTLATVGNLNNLIGVPLTLFGLGPEHRFAVVEMGMNRFGEIDTMTRMVRPHVGLITLVAAAHTEGVGGIAGVAQAKGELFDALPEGAVAIVNADDPYIAARVSRLRVPHLTFGRREGVDVRLVRADPTTLEGTRARIAVRGEEVEVMLPQVGVHQAQNATAAMASALALDIPIASMVRGLAKSACASGRMNVRRGHGFTVLDDTYNANPQSVLAALDTVMTLAAPSGARPVAILGDMRELGTESRERHEEVGRAAVTRVSALFAFGPESEALARAARDAGLAAVFHDVDFDALCNVVRQHVTTRDLVLVKGSRGMRTERFVAALLGAAHQGAHP